MHPEKVQTKVLKSNKIQLDWAQNGHQPTNNG